MASLHLHADIIRIKMAPSQLALIDLNRMRHPVPLCKAEEGVLRRRAVLVLHYLASLASSGVVFSETTLHSLSLPRIKSVT